VWHEDFGDTFVQLSNSPTLCAYCGFYMVAILAYNVSANTVTQCLSAVVRSILEACRTLGVWVASLLIFYAAGTSCGAKAIGERWTAWSFLELAGFGVLLFGTFAYKVLTPPPPPLLILGLLDSPSSFLRPFSFFPPRFLAFPAVR
jgi:hypothetical protein